jgi:hypothetical protein
MNTWECGSSETLSPRKAHTKKPRRELESIRAGGGQWGYDIRPCDVRAPAGGGGIASKEVL